MKLALGIRTLALLALVAASTVAIVQPQPAASDMALTQTGALASVPLLVSSR